MSVEVLTFGCRLNLYESEAMRELASGALLRDLAAGAPLRDAIVVNTCAVTAEAERQARQAIRRSHRENPDARIIVTGCAAQIAPERWAALPGVERVIGNADKLDAKTWAGLDAPPAPVSDIMAARDTAAHLVTRFSRHARAFVQVQQGCDHRCTFCVIPFGRGPSRSVPVGAVVDQVRALVAAGYREVVLTGVDIASYGADLPGAPTLGAMVRRLLRLVPELPRLRLSSLDPVAMDEDLWRAIAEEARLMPHLHLSLQHGADLILKRMKRRHLRADAIALARRARDLRPDVVFGADLIAGFPTETEAHVEQTIALVGECDISFLHVFPYSARPGTPAARMPALPMAERRARATRLREAGRVAAERLYASRAGREESALMEGPERGHTEHFVPVRLASGSAIRGEIRGLRVTGWDQDGLLAEAA